MKKRISVIIMLSMTVMMLSACGRSANTGMVNGEAPEELQESTVQAETMTDEESIEPVEDTDGSEVFEEEVSDNTVSMDEAEEEEDTIPTHAVIEVSETPHDGVFQLSDNFFLTEDEGTLTVWDGDGNKFVEGNITAADALYYDRYFYLDIDKVSTLFDKDGNLIMDCTDYPGYYIEAVYEDGIQLSSIKNGTADSIYLNWEGDELLRINPSVVKGIEEASPLINGAVDVATWEYFDGEHMANICMQDGTLACIPETNPEYKYGVHTYGTAMGKDGYVLARPMAPNRKDYLDLYYYSFKDKKYIPVPEPADRVDRYKCDDGIKHYIFNGQYAFIASKIDNKKAVFDVKNEELVTDFKYKSIGRIGMSNEKEKFFLVTDEKGEKWGFLDEKCKEIGKWYDDASYFVDKCAVVKDETGIYVVNENFEQISEPIEGEGTMRFFDNWLAVLRGDKWYFAEIKFK